MNETETNNKGKRRAEDTVSLSLFWLDDKSEDILPWAKWIRRRGDSVELFNSSAALLDRIEESPHIPDLILLDAYLKPEEPQGFELLPIINEKWPFIRVALVTGLTERFDRQFSRKSDIDRLQEIAYRFLTKPLEKPELRWLLEHVRREKRLEHTFSLDQIGPEAVKQILDSISDEVMVVDLNEDKGKYRILYANETRKRIHGNDIIGAECSKLFSADREVCAQNCVCERARSNRYGKAVTYNHLCRRPDDTYYHVSERSSVFFEGGSTLAVNVVRDEEASFQLSRLADKLASAEDEDSIWSYLTDGILAMGYKRARVYRIISSAANKLLIPSACKPRISNWSKSAGIEIKEDQYFRETKTKGRVARFKAWEHGKAARTAEVGVKENDYWVETIITRFGSNFALLVVDNVGGGKDLGSDDMEIIGRVGKALGQRLEVLYDRKERNFLEELYEGIGKCRRPDDALLEVVRIFKHYLVADACGIFMFAPEPDILYRRFGLWGKGNDDFDFDFKEIYPLDDPNKRGVTGEQFLKATTATLIPKVKDQKALHGEYCMKYEGLLRCEFKSALYLPIIDQGERIGILRALNRRDLKRDEVVDFSEPQRRTASLALGQVTPVIRDLLGWEEATFRSDRLKSLTEISRALNEEDDPAHVMKVIVNEATNLLSAKSASLFTLAAPDEKYQMQLQDILKKEDVHKDVFILRSTTERFFMESSSSKSPFQFFYLNGEPEVGMLAGSSEVVSISRIEKKSYQDKYISKGRPVPTHFIGTRLWSAGDDSVIGMLALTNKLSPDMRLSHVGFAAADEELLNILAKQASLAIKNTSIMMGREQALRRITTLHSLTDVFHTFHTQQDRRKILFLFLTGLTIGDGLGFNRAILLLPDEKGENLIPYMSIGPNSEEEAKSVWEHLEKKKFSFEDAVKSYNEKSIEKSSNVQKLLEDCRFPLAKEERTLPVAVWHDGKARNIDRSVNMVEISSNFSSVLDSNAFALMPLKIRGEVLGVVYVDNRFNARPITEHDMKLLEIFCANGAVALVTLRTIEAAVRSDALWSAQTAHRLSNRIFAHSTDLQGIQRQLMKIEPNTHRALDIVSRLKKELRRTKNLFNDLLATFRFERHKAEIFDPKVELSSMISYWSERWKNIEFELSIKEEIKLRTVRSKVEIVLTELVSNSSQAMSGQGRIIITCKETETGAVRNETDRSRLRIEVEDTGSGIPEQKTERIFDEGYTERDGGQGMGLPIARRTAREDLMGDLVFLQSKAGACFVLVLSDLE